MATRTLTVNLVGRTAKLEKSFHRVGKSADTMSARIGKAALFAGKGMLGIGAAAVGAAMALKPMIDQAASVEESLSKNRVLFGDNAKAIEAFAKTSLQSFGVSRRAALEATGVFGALTAAMKLPQEQGVELATTMVGLAGDLSSFHDVGVDEALLALQSGLRGEAEPLRRFGVLLDAATLKTKALEMGIIDNVKKALTPQQKALAAYEVILEQASVAMGDFERTADGAVGQQKLLAGELDHIKTMIGAALLPAFTSLVSYMNENVVPALEDFVDEPSAASAGTLFGQIFWGAFGKEGPSTDIMVGTGPTATLDYNKAGLAWSRGFWDFVQNFFAAGGPDGGKNLIPDDVMTATGTKLEEMFAEIAANFGVDIADVINREGRRNEPSTDVINPELHSGFWGGPPDTAFVDPFGGNTPGVGTFGGGIFGDDFSLDDFSNSLDEALADSMAEIATMNDALAEAVAGQAEVDALFDDLMAEVEELRLAAMDEGDITGTGPGLATVGGASPFGSPPAASTGPTADELTDVASFLSGGGVQEFFGPGGMGGPPNTQVNVTINAPAVTGKEVIDAMADAVRIGGPFERQWVGR